MVVGEVSGMTLRAPSLQQKLDAHGQGQIIMCIYDTEGRLVARTVSESDGYFNYLGLKPGHYTVRPDATQLSRLHLQAFPDLLPIHIKEGTEGDVADGLEFMLIPEDQK